MKYADTATTFEKYTLIYSRSNHSIDEPWIQMRKERFVIPNTYNEKRIVGNSSTVETINYNKLRYIGFKTYIEIHIYNTSSFSFVMW